MPKDVKWAGPSAERAGPQEPVYNLRRMCYTVRSLMIPPDTAGGNRMKPITPIRRPWAGTMTARERFTRQLRGQSVDRCYNMEFGYWK